MNLYNTKQGHSYKISDINGGKGVENKLESMGIIIGTEVKRVNSSFSGGPAVIEVGNSKFALGKGMASKIKVKDLQ